VVQWEARWEAECTKTFASDAETPATLHAIARLLHRLFAIVVAQKATFRATAQCVISARRAVTLHRYAPWHLYIAIVSIVALTDGWLHYSRALTVQHTKC
jgi:hypothetical protein